MVTPPPNKTPFGLEPNVAAGLAYLLGLIGGIIMLVGGGTDRFVKWAAAQSITLFGGYFVIIIALNVLFGLLSAVHLGLLFLFLLPVEMILGLVVVIFWFWAWITAFQGKEVRLPIVAALTERIFASQLL